MLKLLYFAEPVVINLKYIASNTSLMISLSVGYLQILASGYLDNKFTIRFSSYFDERLGCLSYTEFLNYENKLLMYNLCSSHQVLVHQASLCESKPQTVFKSKSELKI